MSQIPSIPAGSLPTQAPQLAPTGSSPIGSNIPSGENKSDLLDSLLNLGVEVTGAITQARRQSGAAASRQQRIAACGRKPLAGKEKKRIYNECVANLGMGAAPMAMPISQNEPKSGRMWLWITLGLVAVGGITYYFLRKK